MREFLLPGPDQRVRMTGFTVCGGPVDCHTRGPTRWPHVSRIEQRFGRVHRIGQTEVWHMWNLVAYKTREGQVYRRLLDKLPEMRDSLADGAGAPLLTFSPSDNVM